MNDNTKTVDTYDVNANIGFIAMDFNGKFDPEKFIVYEFQKFYYIFTLLKKGGRLHIKQGLADVAMALTHLCELSECLNIDKFEDIDIYKVGDFVDDLIFYLNGYDKFLCQSILNFKNIFITAQLHICQKKV
jgi:hypothetical protein